MLLLVLVPIPPRPLSHLWVRAIQGDLSQTLCVPQSSRITGLSARPFNISAVHVENYARCQLSLVFSQRPHTLRQFDLVCAISVTRVKKTLRHGVPLPRVWLNDHFPVRFTLRQISFHDHFSLFLLLA